MGSSYSDVRIIQGFIRFLRKRWRLLTGLGILSLVVVFILTGIYTVPVNMTGAVFRFGDLVNDGVKPGIHFALPAPVNRVRSINTTEVRSMTAGEGESFITGDENIIDMAATIQFRITGYGEYLTGSEDWDKVMRQGATAVLSRIVAGMNIDEVLTTGKSRIQLEAREKIQELLEGYGAGISIMSVSLSSITPPREAASSFRRVADARSRRAELVNKARSERNRKLAQARGEAAALVRGARSEAEELVKRAEGTAERFEDLEAEYRGEVNAFDLYVSSVKESLARARVVLLEDGVLGSFELNVLPKGSTYPYTASQAVSPVITEKRDPTEVPSLTEPREIHEREESSMPSTKAQRPVVEYR
ncbi:MAG: FtsH protease activity modulator HflK [Spirochaetales bacterium]|nr:FtsH protease activity modulator HflK [Spirochaetales bacterium]